MERAELGLEPPQSCAPKLCLTFQPKEELVHMESMRFEFIGGIQCRYKAVASRMLPKLLWCGQLAKDISSDMDVPIHT